MGMTKTSAHRRPFTPLPTLGRDAAKVSNEPTTEEPILRCARTQRNVCFGAVNIHAASQLWILSFVRNVENFSEAVAAQRTKLSFPMSVMLAS